MREDYISGLLFGIAYLFAVLGGSFLGAYGTGRGDGYALVALACLVAAALPLAARWARLYR